MNKFVPKNKMSKKAKAALNSQMRKPPVPPTRIGDSKRDAVIKEARKQKARHYIDE